MKQVLGVDVKPRVEKERVLDVPAIDMTDTATPARTASSPSQRRNATRSPARRTRPARTAEAAAKPKRSRDGSVGRNTFEQVEALLKQGKNKTEAFASIAATTGKNRGAVAASYYRAARVNSAVKPRKRPADATPATATRGRPRATPNPSPRAAARSHNARGSVDQIIGQLIASVAALTEAVKAQDAEVRELRGRLDGVRTLLG
jgi:hypothetical protein